MRPFPPGGTIGAHAMNGDFEACRFKTFGQDDPCRTARGQRDVEDAVASVAMKMTMFAHVRTKPRRAAIHRHLSRHAGSDERVEAIVNCGHRDVRHFAFGANEHFFGARMIALVQQYIINLPALRCETKAARQQALRQVIARRFRWAAVHFFNKLDTPGQPVNIWNNSKYGCSRPSRRKTLSKPEIGGIRRI